MRVIANRHTFLLGIQPMEIAIDKHNRQMRTRGSKQYTITDASAGWFCIRCNSQETNIEVPAINVVQDCLHYMYLADSLA